MNSSGPSEVIDGVDNASLADFSDNPKYGDHLKKIDFWYRKLSRRAVQLVGSNFYINPDQEVSRSILIAGTARSGTTWLGDLIATQIPCRIMFEPFNPDLVPEYSPFHYFQYMQPGEQDQNFYLFARKVLSGEIRNRWIDRQNERIFPQYRLIKEIRANLALKWLHKNFPAVPILFIIRHPCAVVLSRMSLGWATDSDIQPFLVQQDLVADHLAGYLNLIAESKSDEEKHAIIWSVSNLVPLKQFEPGDLQIVYYENLCTQPEIEVPRIFDTIHQKFEPSMLKTIHQPSLTTKATSAVVTGINKITHWKDVLSPIQIDKILRVVQAFGLDDLYGDALSPLNSTTASHVVN